MNGILIIDKPAGFTSHDVVARLRRILQTKKIGHTGTLDPFATGVLVMLVGKATRLAQFLDKDEKSYEADLRFGFETDTGDRTGERRETEFSVHNSPSNKRIAYSELREALIHFTGEITQIPPMYSAKKIDGKKLYELARKGVEVERKAVNVTISKLEIVEDLTSQENPEIQEFRIRVTCTAGTYIRTLAEDIGKKIGVGCHLSELRRTNAGKFDISQAVTLEELEEIVSRGGLDEILISMNEGISHLNEKILNENELQNIAHGKKVGANFGGESVLDVRLTDEAGELAAIGTYDRNTKQIQPRIVFLN